MSQPTLTLKTFSDWQDYESTWRNMRELTHARTQEAPGTNEVWFLEHAPVFTQGQAGKAEHILSHQHHIPIVQSDRGGQVTYHGPGQLMIYLLLNLKQYGFHAKSYVQFLEQAIIVILEKYHIVGFTQENAPGVYVYLPNSNEVKKIASIGIRIRKNFSYHGICLNINGDLTPFNYINPCGYQNLGMAQLSDFEQTKQITITQIIKDFSHYFQTHSLFQSQEVSHHV